MELYRGLIVHAICKQSHHYCKAQADWRLLIPIILLAQHLNILVQCLL